METWVGEEVVYKGGLEEEGQLFDAKNLVKGNRYLVIREERTAWQTNIELKDVQGSFNVKCFRLGKPTKKHKRENKNK